jgi:hypothetical protein
MARQPPTAHLALAAGGGGTVARAREALAAPTVRLGAGGHLRPGRQLFAEPAPTIRLAWGGPPGAQTRGLSMAMETTPALLVSYVYFPMFQRERPGYHFRDWVMDSGAFSADRSGTAIELAAYIDACKELLATDPMLTEVYALDVIGDWRASMKNTDAMWAAGVPAIPCYHVGEPEDALLGMARDYPKIALGGAVGLKTKVKRAWAAQCFARIWPKAVHGFGFGAEWSVMELPFHSVDATNWEQGPCRFGNWKSFGDLSIRGGRQDLRAEVVWHLRLEARARQKWAALWQKHPELCQPAARGGVT